MFRFEILEDFQLSVIKGGQDLGGGKELKEWRGWHILRIIYEDIEISKY